MEVRPDRYIAVVGGVNTDIKGQAFSRLIPGDSNPGKVKTSVGGVGRNIAHNLRLMGAGVVFFTAIGTDDAGDEIRKSCESLGIDISHALNVPDISTSSYLFINDETGNMAMAVSDMGIMERVTPAYLEEHLDIINGASVVVADLNIPKESARYLCENCRAPLFIDPVSVTKAAKIKDCLSGVHTLKPNKVEAGFISDVKITDDNTLREAARRILEAGVKRVFISLGEDGVLFADGRVFICREKAEADTVNTTGAGDAFMAALAFAHMKGLPDEAALDAAIRASAKAVESAQTVNPDLRASDIFGTFGS